MADKRLVTAGEEWVESQTAEKQRAIRLVTAVVLVLVFAGLIAWLGLNRQQAAESQLPQSAELDVMTNSLGMRLIKIPGGEFVMGGERPEQSPQRRVRVAPFYISAHEVSQAQWQAVMGFNPSEYKDPRRPVEQVTWLETQSFLEQLNRLEGTNRYRLPSEAEWEYAARAGSSERYFFGNDASQLGRYAWFDISAGTRPVGRKAPNPWGLYDIYGNVWEWVQDCWHEDYQGAPADSRVWGGGDCSRRGLRGGGWNNDADYLGSAVRGSYAVDFEDVSSGFRIVLNP